MILKRRRYLYALLSSRHTTAKGISYDVSSDPGWEINLAEEHSVFICLILDHMKRAMSGYAVLIMS